MYQTVVVCVADNQYGCEFHIVHIIKSMLLLCLIYLVNMIKSMFYNVTVVVSVAANLIVVLVILLRYILPCIKCTIYIFHRFRTSPITILTIYSCNSQLQQDFAPDLKSCAPPTSWFWLWLPMISHFLW